MNNYELHVATHTCHDECQNPICVAVRKAVLAEREACAKVCDELVTHARTKGDTDAMFAAIACALVIRERGAP